MFFAQSNAIKIEIANNNEICGMSNDERNETNMSFNLIERGTYTIKYAKNINLYCTRFQAAI